MELVVDVGLGLIVVGWAVQILSALRGSREISNWFLALYAVGVAALVVDGLGSGATAPLLLNFLALAAAVLILAVPAKKQPARAGRK